MTEKVEQITVDGVTITVVRSANREKTVSLQRVDGQYVLRAPVVLGADELQRLAGRLLTRFTKRQRGQALNDDDALRRRADELNRAFFGGTLHLAAIRYVTNQRRCYGSCTPSQATIRISDTVATLPDWVRDYVIVHELAHLAEANHGPRFWKLVNRYPLSERARGYLMALGMEEGGADQPAGPDAAQVDGAGVF